MEPRGMKELFTGKRLGEDAQPRRTGKGQHGGSSLEGNQTVKSECVATKKGWWSGIGPEFKSQYHQKKKANAFFSFLLSKFFSRNSP
jgi:hypothetical protein